MKLPQYALKADQKRRVQILCRGACGKGRHAEITDTTFNKALQRPSMETKAKCLMCGYIASDPYNWDLK